MLRHLAWLMQKDSLGQDALLTGPPGPLRRRIALAYCELAGRSYELVRLTQDSSEADFESYRATMPWLAMPHGGNLPALLAALYHVSAIPCLVLLDAEGTLVSTDGLRLLRKHTRAGCCRKSTGV